MRDKRLTEAQAIFEVENTGRRSQNGREHFFIDDELE